MRKASSTLVASLEQAKQWHSCSPWKGIERRDSHPRTEVFSALGQPVLMHGSRPSWDQVQQPGRGMILPTCQVRDAGERTWAPAASVLVVHYVFIAPSTRTPAKWAGASDAACRHGLIWDHTVFHVVPSWRANPDIVAPSKRNCRIAQRIARTPKRALGAHTEWFCSVKVAIWQVCSRHIQHRIVPPDPRRDPSPGRVDHLHHHAPVALSDHPTPRAANHLVARLNIEHQGL